MSDYTPEQIDSLCEVMHDAYEEAAIKAGWETQKQSRVEWSSVPEANKQTMYASVQALLSSVAMQENLAERDRLIAERVWDEAEAYSYEHGLGHNPYRGEA